MREIFFKGIKGELKELDSIRDGCWINIEKASMNDLEWVAEITGLDLPDIEEALDPYELPRIERHEDKVIIFVRDAEEQERGETFTNLLTIIITSKYFITIALGKNNTIKSIIRKGMLLSTTQRSKLCLYVLLLISKNFTKEIKLIKNNVAAERGALDNIESLDIVNLIKNEEILNQYISILVPMRNVFEAVAKGGYIQLYSYDNELLEDLIISIKQSADICLVSAKGIRSLRESYQAIFTNKLNKTIRLLTSFTIILTVPTIIASIYGMNVRLPFAESANAFNMVMFSVLLISSFFLIIFYKNKWL